ncbi:hypothetical protein [Acinetobacter higginsii]|uniref:hypothetical protein n=1 Tax=Acinetobacter higginsii TaxID=70347 RepID=UPI003009CBDA
MKNLITFTIFSMLFLSGCGEDGSFSAGGVSLGGTGTGIPPLSGSNNNPPKPGNPDENGPILIQPDHFELVYPFPQYPQNCDGIERVFQFIDKASGKIILEGSRSNLSSMNTHDLTNVLLRLKVKNTSSSMAYEYIGACRTPIKIIDTFNGVNTELNTNQRFSCDGAEYIQIYQANEEKIYNFDFDLPNRPTIWQFDYQPTYSFELLPEKTKRTECPALSISLIINVVEKSAPPAKIYLEDGITIISPPSLPPVNLPSENPVVVEPPVEPPIQPPVLVEPPIQPPILVEPPIQPPVLVEPPIQPPILVEPPIQPPVLVEPPIQPPVLIEPPIEPQILVESSIKSLVLVEPPTQPSIFIKIKSSQQPLVLMQTSQQPPMIIQLDSPTLRSFLTK